ncbi:MAG: MFS transporter [Ardenticatenaceae bacterium]|nr:MFS transporter [Ardenticatenaceae bacterium]
MEQMVDKQTGTARADLVWLVGVSLVLLLISLPFSSYAVSVPIIQAEWALTNTEAAVLFSLFLIGYALSSLVLLPLTDRVTPEKILLAGAVVVSLAHLLFPLLARGFVVGGALRFLMGMGQVAAYIPGVQMVSERFRLGKRGTAVGLFVAAGYAGTTLSYSFTGLMLERAGGWRSAYLTTSLVGLVGVALAVWLLWLVRNNGNRLSAISNQLGKKGKLDLGVLRDRPVMLVILGYALHTAELYLARLWFPLLLGVALVNNGRSPLEATATAATYSGFMFMMGIIGVMAGGYLSDYLGRGRGAALIFALSGLCSFVVGWLTAVPTPWLIGLGFFYGFVTAADSAIYSTAVTELAPPGKVGSTQAVQSFLGFTIGAVVPVLAGGILDSAGGTAVAWGLAFTFNGLLAVVGVASQLYLQRLTGKA